MSAGRLTDDELRAAAARRPGYATYAEYRPSQRERLGRLPLPASRPLRTQGAPPLVPARAQPARTTALDIVTQPPTAPPRTGVAASVTLALLPPSPVFQFQPHRSPGRQWWRRRWNWSVMPATGPTAWGYAWTESGARRLTARAARRAAR